MFESLTLLLVFASMALNDLVDCIDAARRSRPELLYLNIPLTMLFAAGAWVKGQQLRRLGR